MKRRFTINEDGNLEDRQGVVLGKVVGITLDVPSTPPSPASDPASDAEPAGAGSSGGRGLFFLEGEQQQEEKEKANAAGARGSFDPVLEVWEHYCRVMDPRHKGLDSQTRKVIREALAVATLSECKRAIDGCRSSDFHMGKNDRGRKYNAVSQILKGKRGGRTTRENIDFFLDLAEKAGLQSGVPSGGNEKVRRAKRAVLDAAEFPGDEHVAERGRSAEAWLVEQGWRIEREDGRMPRFVAPGDDA